MFITTVCVLFLITLHLYFNSLSCFCKQVNLYCLLYIADFLKTWSIKTTEISLELGQTRVFISLISPKITEKRDKSVREREREREKKGLAQSLAFIV